jgi:hypothetical protein
VAASAHGTELNPDMVEFPREANAAFTTGTKEAQRCAAFWAIAAHCFAQTEDSRAPALAKRLSDEFDATTMYAASMAKKLGMDEQKFQEYNRHPRANARNQQQLRQSGRAQNSLL